MPKDYSSNKKTTIFVMNLTTYSNKQEKNITYFGRKITTMMKDHGCSTACINLQVAY